MFSIETLIILYEIQHKTINQAFLTFVQEPYNCEIYVIDSGNVSELLFDGKANPIHPFFLQYDHILSTKGVEGPKEERKWTVMKEILGERKDYSNVFFIDHKLKYIEVADKHLPMQNNIYVEEPITIKTTQYPHLEELLQKLVSKYNSGHFSPTEVNFCHIKTNLFFQKINFVFPKGCFHKEILVYFLILAPPSHNIFSSALRVER